MLELVFAISVETSLNAAGAGDSTIRRVKRVKSGEASSGVVMEVIVGEVERCPNLLIGSLLIACLR